MNFFFKLHVVPAAGSKCKEVYSIYFFPFSTCAKYFFLSQLPDKINIYVSVLA